MEIDAFTQRQRLLYFRNSLLKLGQSCERHLDFNIILRLAKQQKINDLIFSLGLLVFTVVQRAIPHLS